MASKKKPAKPIAGQSKQPAQDPLIYGTLIRYVGAFGAHTECPCCGKKTVRGMVRFKNDEFYCSARCASIS